MLVPEDSRGSPVFREPEIEGGRSLSTSASVAHFIEHRLAKKRLRSNIKKQHQIASVWRISLSSRRGRNFSANFIQRLLNGLWDDLRALDERVSELNGEISAIAAS